MFRRLIPPISESFATETSYNLGSTLFRPVVKGRSRTRNGNCFIITSFVLQPSFFLKKNSNQIILAIGRVLWRIEEIEEAIVFHLNIRYQVRNLIVTCLVTKRVPPVALCFCFFLMSLSVTFLPSFQSIF